MAMIVLMRNYVLDLNVLDLDDLHHSVCDKNGVPTAFEAIAESHHGSQYYNKSGRTETNADTPSVTATAASAH